MSALPQVGQEPGKHYHDVIALATSDWHLDTHRPSARAEANWLDVLYGYMQQLKDLQQMYSAPILVPGDLFNRWDPPPHIINWALAYLPDNIYAVPGNHDLPGHSYKEVDKSAYWSLVEAKKIVTVTPGPFGKIIDCFGGTLEVHAYTCGFEVQPQKPKKDLSLRIAMIHDYIWTKDTGHEKAPPEKRYGKWAEKLVGYDIAIFGDNHRGWLIQSDTQCSVLNCGCLVRRRADEKNYRPAVGLIHANGQITRHYLDTSKDKFVDEAEKVEQIESALKINLADFVSELARARAKGVDWKKTVILWCKKNDIDQATKDIIISCVEDIDDNQRS